MASRLAWLWRCTPGSDTVLMRQGLVVPAPATLAVTLASRQGVWLVSVYFTSTAVGVLPRSRSCSASSRAIWPSAWL